MIAESKNKGSKKGRRFDIEGAASGSMSSFERYMAVIEHASCDILPRLPILMAFAANHIGATYGEFASDYRVLARANERCVEDFGFDQLSAISDPYRETTGFGGEVELIAHGVPRLISSPLANSKDLTRLKKPDPYKSPRMKDRLEAVEELTSRYEGQYSILGWVEGPAAEAADLRGVMNFFYDTMDDPKFCHELMERCVDTALDFAAAQLKAGADTIGIGDAIVSQISPQVYTELIFPHQQRLVQGIQACGGLVRLHICGDISQHLPTMKGLGMNILDLDWPVDMAYARSVMGEQVILVANPDPVADIERGNPEAIRAKMRQLYAVAGNPFMLGAGCEIPLGTPDENLKALCAPIPYTI